MNCFFLLCDISDAVKLFGCGKFWQMLIAPPLGLPKETRQRVVNMFKNMFEKVLKKENKVENDAIVIINTTITL